MKIVLTLEEVKNIVCDFVQKSQGGGKPKEVCFVHKFYDGSGEINIEEISKIDRVEVRY